MVEIRILLVEDSETDAMLILRNLARQGLNCQSLRVQTSETLEKALTEGVWDVVVSDYNLPSFDGLLALEMVRSKDLDLPFILVSGKVGEEMAVNAMRSGASDFLTKDHLDRLGPAIERELRETHTRRTHRRYEAERRTLLRAIGQAPDSIVVTDREGVIIYVNPATEAISGYNNAELVGQKPSIFKSDHHDTRYYENLWQTILRGEVWRGALVNKRKNGSLWNAESAISPVWDGEGKLVNFVCTGRDTTHEHLLQHQLEQSQRLTTLGTLAAGIAHDFNNLLMPILGYVELAKEHSGLDGSLRKDLEIIEASAVRASGLAQQILGFSRAQNKQRRPLDLSLLLADSLKLLRAALPSSIRFEVTLAEGSGSVMGDATQLHQVILNLCTNAAHAMRGQSGTLKVDLRREMLSETVGIMESALPAGPYLCLTVADEGRGMSPETLSHIFLPFFTTKTAGEGTGLGLSILLGIVRDIGGNVQVDSELGRGTTFRIYFPIHSDEPLSAARPEGAVQKGQGRILLVDDEVTILGALKEGLTNKGFTVVAQADPLAALREFCAQVDAFDLILTDLTMPGLSGLQLAAEIRRVSPGVPILLMTGDASSLTTERCRELGFQDLILKPAGIQQVLRVIHDAMARTEI